jgi:hypothetical protein
VGLVLLALAAVSCCGPSAEQRAEDPAGDEPAEGEEQAVVDLEHPLWATKTRRSS